MFRQLYDPIEGQSWESGWIRTNPVNTGTQGEKQPMQIYIAKLTKMGREWGATKDNNTYYTQILDKQPSDDDDDDDDDAK